ncbi:hypothetical protein [Pandoraea sp. NPDC087047]|uniref:hypothetical protein n=1 Tax=Pandoraea sp. NPDC087047 TaxID=3364390 RepID=UPI003814C9F3
MSLTAHHRALGAAPCYGAPHAAPRKKTNATFPGAFRRARTARAQRETVNVSGKPRSVQHTAWPAAFALMLVANLIAPATAALPSRFRQTCPDDWEPHRANPPYVRPALPAQPSPDVVVRAVEAKPTIKSDYTPFDVFKAVAAGASPFSKTGESIMDVYTVVSDNEVAPDVRQAVRSWTGAVDIVTGMVPDVQMLRLPSEMVEMAVDMYDGKSPSFDRMNGLIQLASPRGSHAHTSRDMRPERRPGRIVHAPNVPAPASPWPAHSPANGKKSAPKQKSPKVPRPMPKETRAGGARTRVALHGNEILVRRFPIEGEAEHLTGYAQVLPRDRQPADRTARLVFVGGQRYLRGDAGYYRATPGLSDDHWLIDAPRKNKAQVPVTYDPMTGQWQAQPSLRLCGGGCGPSRPLTIDSIAGSYADISAATRHIPDRAAAETIQNAFADVSRLNLIRSNRADLRAMRDNSIVDHRAALRTAMKGIDRRLPLAKQQRLAAEVTATYYYSHPFAEAFCQENAEVLLHFLLQDGIDVDHLRMITVKPKNKPPHVMVLYTESQALIELLDVSTPNPRVGLHQDGITAAQFAWEAYMTRETTLLLDPWSRSKAISFMGARTPKGAADILDAAFVDIGHTSGNPCTLSVTRPVASRRPVLSSQSSGGSLESAASLGATSWTSMQSGSSPSDSPDPRRA